MTVWIVKHRDRVVGVFSTRDRAEREAFAHMPSGRVNVSVFQMEVDG